MISVEQRLTGLASANAINLVSASRSSNFSTTSTTAVDVTGLSVTITTSGRPVMVIVSAQDFYVSATGSAVGELGISFDGVDTWIWQHETPGNTYRNVSGIFSARVYNVFAGTYIIKARMKTNAGTARIDASSTAPAQFLAYEL